MAVSGIVNASVRIRLTDMFSTSYGWLVVAKAVALLPLHAGAAGGVLLELLRTGRTAVTEERVDSGETPQVLLTCHRPARIADRLITCSAARFEIRSRSSSLTASTSWIAIRPFNPHRRSRMKPIATPFLSAVA